MRTKVERTCKKTAQRKVNISLPSPKVVLNANDCARLLDSMGKTNVLLVENEVKMVATTSRTSPVQLSSIPTSSTTSSLCSLSSASRNVSSTLLAATQTKICKNWVSLNSTNSSTISAENTDSAHIERTNKEGVKEDHSDISVQTQMILKPPKKRRGIDKKYEEITPTSFIFNNEDAIHSALPSKGELVDECFVQRGANTPPLTLPSHRDVFQKHSVDQLLQHSPGSSVGASNNQSLISSYSHDSRSHILSMNDLPLSSPHTASTTLSSSLSTNFENYMDRTSCASQLYNHSFCITNQLSQNHVRGTYLGHTSSVECLPSLSNLVSANKTLTHAGNFHQIPEQIEPMNLSTSCKPAIDIASFHTNSHKAEDVSVVFSQQQSLAHGFSEPSHVSSGNICETPMQMLENNNSEIRQSKSKPMEVPQDVSYPAVVSSEQDMLDQSIHNGESDCVSARKNNGIKDTQVSKTSEPPVASDLPLITASAISLIEQNNETEAYAGEHAEKDVSSLVKQNPQSQSLNYSTQLPGSGTTKTMLLSPPKDSQTVGINCNESPLEDSQAVGINCNESLTVFENETAKKNKRPAKKKVKVPMDEMSSADRMHRYSLTIDDVIVNFVYIPEPLEEFSLTEEEEAAIRDQFENVHESSNAESTNTESTDTQINHLNGINIIDNACAANQTGQDSLDKLTANGETHISLIPRKKRPTSELAGSTAGSHQDVPKAVENIDSVLAFVAGDCFNSAPSVDDRCNDSISTSKRKKSKNTLVGNASSKSKKVIKDIVSSKVNIQHNADSLVESSSEKANVIDSSEYSLAEDTENISKTKKIKKKKSGIEETPVIDHTTVLEVDGTAEDKVSTLFKKKTSDQKLKSTKKKKTDSKQTVLATYSVNSQVALTTEKETVCPNRVETSDIGESIASTSGGSEQDTPVHEAESKDEMTEAQVTDRDNHDTGLESGGDDKPVRQYKKRLDFVKCDQCDHQARGRSALSRHMKKVHMLDVNMPFRCEHCDYGCTKMASLNRHLFTHGIYPCSRCRFVADERNKLTEHTMEKHKDKLDVKMCKVCNRYIKCDLITIEQHMQECQGPTPFQCTECEKEFKYASSLRVHYHIHFPDQPKRFKCDQCDYRTNYKANLHKHHKNMHASRDRDVQCPECGKLFSTEDNMRRHRKVHTLVRPFACGTCEKTFKTSGALKGHQLIHTATRPYTCNIPGCNRNFRTAKFLKSHQEEFHRLVPKKFFCSVEGCTYSFFKRSHLKRHAITHTGERNFHCTWPGCSKSFRHADNLKVHFRSHTNEKPIQCHLCDFKCKQKNSLFWHKKRVHQVIDVSVCPRRLEQNLKPALTDVQNNVKILSDVDGIKNAQVMSSLPVEIAVKTLLVEASTDITRTAEESPRKSNIENSPLVSTIENEPFHSPVTNEHSISTQAVSQEDQNHRDLYEFKSDEESGEEMPGSFRRDKNLTTVLTPLPPPPKELLRKNEILEMKEREKKEKAEKREQERKEKAERKEQEKNKKEERKNLEKKAKAERKELERKEKIVKKEQERKERVEKKEQEKKDKLEKKETEKKEKIEKKEQEKKEMIAKKQQEKIEKKEQEKKEKMERRDPGKKDKSGKTLSGKASATERSNDSEDSTDHEEKIINITKNSPKSLKRRKSPDLVDKDNYVADTKKTRQGRKKLFEDTSDKSKNQTPSLKVEDNENPGNSLPKRKVDSSKKGKQSEEQSSSATSLSSLKTVTAKRNLARKSKKQGKQSPPKRKPSARIKAKNKAKTIKTKSALTGQKSSKPELRRKSVRKVTEPTVKETKELKQDDMDTDDVNAKADIHKGLTKLEESQPILEENKILPKSNLEESLALPVIPTSPAISEEIMLQGKASPYQDFSDAENLENQTESPDSSLSQKQSKCPDIQERSETESDLIQYEKIETSTMDRHTSHPVEEYSDDDVSNDIPLTPPRAPAPPPMESSEDEMELEPEATPFSVPGPNTPFSVPGPNTPFSIPPPTSLTQQHSVHSEEAPMSVIPSVPSMEVHSQGSVDKQQSLESVEIHPHGSEEMNHSHGSVEMHHSQSSFEMPHTHSSMEIRSLNALEMRSHGSMEMQPRGSVERICHGSITSIPHSEQQVRTPESVMRDISNNPMCEKYELPQSLQEQTQTSEADKEYFDQYLKSLSAASGDLQPSPGGLQQLEAMVVKSHFDSKEMNSKSPISYLPTSVITGLESTLPLLSHGDLRARMDALVSDRHHESLYIRDTPSLPRLPDRQTPLPPSVMGHSPAFDTFSSLNSFHPAVANGSRENSYLRQAENLFPTPPGASSFMAEAMFQRQAVSTPFLPHQQTDRSSLSRIQDSTQLQSSSSSSLLRRSGTVPGSDMFSPPTMAQSIPRHPFANSWASQDVRAAHWQSPYLSHQSNMAATGSFFPTKDNYLTGRDFMFDPSVRPTTERSMFPSLSSSQSQDSFQLDRFDLSNYFPNAMTPYGSSTGSLEYSRSAHAAAAKPFDNRYRQTAAAAAAIPDFRGLPPTGGSTDMFSGLPGVNTGFNLYAGNPMSYHAQHMTDNVNSAFLTHTTSAQHAMFERDYAAAHRSFYPQNAAYPFVDERQYSGASKMGHSHPVAPTPAPQERDLMSRSAAPESQMQDPYRSLLYRY